MTKTVALLPELVERVAKAIRDKWWELADSDGYVLNRDTLIVAEAAIEATQTDQQLREALAELEQQATATLGAIDRYNEENGTSLGGAPMFKLGRAIARARSYLSSSLTK